MSKKGGFLTPKAIANRIKAKGLQKLRWYCQMCQKQCRDENGFKCHTMSESHQRQLLLFAENPDEYIDTFSEDFEQGYTELLRRRFGTRRVQCNIVYQEYIAQRDHTHMNSTQWETLTDFVKWLGKEGKCEVDYTEKGWFVKYIDRDPETIKKMESVKTKERMEMDDTERTAKMIQEQVERGALTEKHARTSEFTELKRDNEDEKVTIKLGDGFKKPEPVKTKTIDNPLKNVLEKEDSSSSKSAKKDTVSKPKVGEKRKSALDEIREYEEQKREKTNRKDHWLHKDIVVKVVAKKLGDKYYKKKAVVKDVQDVYGAIVKMIDTGDKIRVDQSHLETVIPGQGKTVLIVNGAYRGEEAVLESINEKRFSCSVSIKSGTLRGRVLDKLPYEDVCKLYQPS